LSVRTGAIVLRGITRLWARFVTAYIDKLWGWSDQEFRNMISLPQLHGVGDQNLHPRKVVRQGTCNGYRVKLMLPTYTGCRLTD
jgi:hypothetical protein